MLEHPTRMLENLIEVFGSQPLQVVDNRHQLVARIVLLLAQPSERVARGEYVRQSENGEHRLTA